MNIVLSGLNLHRNSVIEIFYFVKNKKSTDKCILKKKISKTF